MEMTGTVGTHLSLGRGKAACWPLNRVEPTFVRSHAAAKSYLGFDRREAYRGERANIQSFVPLMPSDAAILTNSANERAPIFRITCPRWIFTVISLTPSWPAICL